MEDNVVKSEGIYLGITTNNQAEYRAVLAGVNTALGMGIEELDVYLDSMLAVNQINGIWKIKNADLIPVYDEIKQLLPHFKRITFTHVPRALNKLADAQVNECLDAQ
jgi:ribonuclease HI